MEIHGNSGIIIIGGRLSKTLHAPSNYTQPAGWCLYSRGLRSEQTTEGRGEEVEPAAVLAAKWLIARLGAGDRLPAAASADPRSMARC